MWNYFSKLLSGFCYGAGFLLAVVCAFYFVNQYSSSSAKLTTSEGPDTKSETTFRESIEIKNISKLSKTTNYVNEGEREEFIFTGELVNTSSKNGYTKLMVEVDLYDSNGKFIFKCGGWDGVGLELDPGATINFQKFCHQMPSEIPSKYANHKVVIRQRKF